MKFSLKLCAITCSLMLSSVANAGLIYTFESGPDFKATIELNDTILPGVRHDLNNFDVQNWQFEWNFTSGPQILNSTNGYDLSGGMTLGPAGEVRQLGLYWAARGPEFIANISYNGAIVFDVLDNYATLHESRLLTVSGPTMSVPEPTPIALFAGGLLAFAVQRKLVKKRKG